MNGNILMSYPNRASQPTLSGGAWTTQLPLRYLKTRQASQVARCVDAQAVNSWFYLTAATAIACGIFAINGHNLTTDGNGKFRLRGWSADPRPVVENVFTGGLLPSGWSCVRASSAWYFDAAGVLQQAAANVARPYFSGSANAGFLVEESATNLLTNSRDGSNATSWSQVNMSRLKTATGLDNVANSATTLTATSATARLTQTISSATGVFSVYLRRKVGTGNVRLSINNFTSSTIVTVGTSWTRVYLVGAASTAVGIQIDTSGDVVEMDCAQWEVTAATTPSTPIVTTTTGATRNVDVLRTTGMGATALTAGALMVKARLLRMPTSASSFVRMANAGGTDDVGFSMSTGGVLSVFLDTSSASQVSGLAGSAVTVGNQFTGAVSWAANDVRASFDGGAVQTDSVVTASASTPSSLDLSPSSGIFAIERCALYAATKTNAQLLGLSGSEMELPADHDSGLVDAWPAAWVAARSSEQKDGARAPAWYAPSTPQTYQYWRVDLNNPTNPSGWLQLGRLWIGDAWQPPVNMSLGASLAYESRDIVIETDSGSEYGYQRPSPRVTQFALKNISDDDAMTKHLEMQRQLRSWGEFLFLWNPQDTTYWPDRSYFARMRKLTPLDIPESTNLWRTSYEAKELL